MIALEDIIEVEITPEMLDEARAEQIRKKVKNVSEKTRLVVSNHDVIGSLAHQIVEKKLEELGLPFETFRSEEYSGGDECDIKYAGDKIDVKGTHGLLDQWFYNKQFLVFSAQFEDEKIEKITNFVFVLVSPDFSRGWIFGEISVSEFLQICTDVKLQYDNKAIRGRHLYPFFNYVYRSGPR